ncbi:hypothetical protein CASFOL_003671 [Castilleja foliolosa]|uniref:Uncharacterized protein n=1 Tax=Castilleja foliolosa TaxID=1961234 RepID=A0ABD3EI64_9LAMI
MTAAGINNEGEMKMLKAKVAVIINKSLEKHSKLFGGEIDLLKSKAATIDKRLKKHPELLSGEVRILKAMAAIVDEKLKKRQKLLSGKPDTTVDQGPNKPVDQGPNKLGYVSSLSSLRAAIKKRKLESFDEDLAANWGYKEHELMKSDIDFVDFEQKRARAEKRRRLKSAASLGIGGSATLLNLETPGLWDV